MVRKKRKSEFEIMQLGLKKYAAKRDKKVKAAWDEFEISVERLRKSLMKKALSKK